MTVTSKNGHKQPEEPDAEMGENTPKEDYFLPNESTLAERTDDELASDLTSFSRKGSALAVSDDPFFPREGKTLLWRNVNMTLVCTQAPFEQILMMNLFNLLFSILS